MLQALNIDNDRHAIRSSRMADHCHGLRAASSLHGFVAREPRRVQRSALDD